MKLCLRGVEGIPVKIKFVAAALAGALMLAANFWSHPANALTFQFSFNNPAVNDPAQGLVQGIISGLQDNTAIQPALSLQVTSNSSGFGLGEYIGNPNSNFFTVSAGIITRAAFLDFGSDNSSPQVTCCTLVFEFIPGEQIDAGLGNGPNGVFQVAANLVFTPVAETPLPAALPLFATGLGALGLLGWRRKRKQAA
jgi:hypothetical protein